jgi:hypothetical protein
MSTAITTSIYCTTHPGPCRGPLPGPDKTPLLRRMLAARGEAMTTETSPLVFLDIETTGLRMDADIWEFAAIRRNSDGLSESLHLFIEHDWKKCAELPDQFLADHVARFPSHDMATGRNDAAHQIRHFLSQQDGQPKPHIVGAVPDFDVYRIRLLVESVCPSWQPEWHHHLIDVENLAVGRLAAKGKPLAPPWDSNDLSRAIGVDPDWYERHTAMGDVLWAQAIYDQVMGDKP